MKVIGLTGGIGSGKTCAAGFLEELGAVIIDSDSLGHEVYKPGTPGWREIVDVFGGDILDSAGKIDRKKLAQKALSSPETHQKLNQILHPKIRHEVESRLDGYRQRGLRSSG
jgi:dephospho-CoA kinase